MIKRLHKFSWHFLLWAIYTLVATSIYGYDVGFFNALPETSASFFVSILVFYFHVPVLERFFNRKAWHLYPAGLIMLILLAIVLKYFIFIIVFPALWKPSSAAGLPISRLVLTFSYQTFPFLLFSAGYWSLFRAIKIERDGRRQDKIEASRRDMEHEIALLRAQINPHFLFNTLSHFSIVARKTHPKLSEDIAALIDLMRASISQPDQDGMIALEKEIIAIESLIRLFKMRFPNMGLKEDITIPRDTQTKVTPHILLAFVENAFKHGALVDPGKTIEIQLTAEDGYIKLHTYNFKNFRAKDMSHGIGLKFVEKLLEERHRGKYSLSIIPGENDYSVNLKMPVEWKN